ncbi:MAG: SRPBCC domain-containing protein [Acidimicrobiia bacterium]|nr:SRPBCC domain-containing protein [Acidimicrobiia bacterium]
MTDAGPATHRQLDFDLFIAASPSTVWQFWVDPDRMCEWWGTEAELDPRPGGIYRVAMSADGPVMSGTYVELQPCERLVFLFGWEDASLAVRPGSTRVEVTMRPERDGTRLQLRHTDLPAASTEAHRDGWEHFLDQLVDIAGR